MKKALIDTQTVITHIVGWTDEPDPKPIYETYPNSARICEVVDTEFEVHPSLVWVDCADDVVAAEYWYDTEAKEVKPIENAQAPDLEQPDMDGLESV